MIEVIKPGLFTTIQDLGRSGYQRFGVVVGGAMDDMALRLANTLVGNAETAAGIEVTLQGPILHFRDATYIALTGGQFEVRANGIRVPYLRPVYIAPETTVEFRTLGWGARAYIAIHDGIAVEEVLGSRSTYVGAQIGGMDGRPLQRGDLLPVPSTDPMARHHELRMVTGVTRVTEESWVSEQNGLSYPHWFSSDLFLYGGKKGRQIEGLRVLPGSEWDRFGAPEQAAFLETKFRVSQAVDRMGARLQGERIRPTAGDPLISEAVTHGTVQVPPDGNPIVLGADRQTTGGYPKIAQVIRADWSKLAQFRPGDEIRFTLITMAEAQESYRGAWQHFELIKRSLAWKGVVPR